MKYGKVKILFWFWSVITVFICVCIFVLSSQNGNNSGMLSQGLTRRLFLGLLSDKSIYIAEKILRKIAHYLIYFSLGISMYLSVCNFNSGYLSRRIKYGNLILPVVLICFLYSVGDEIHQMFIPGRYGAFYDCMIDTFGAFCGILFVLLLKKILKLFKNK